MIHSNPAEILGADGPLARHIPGFAVRAQQQAMADAVMDALESNGVLVAEAGTGTGKTFAYLVPALLSGRKIIISTGTRNLQDQLFHRDLPLVRDALGLPVRAALLKGRANYLCAHRLDIATAGARAATGADLARIRSWAGRTVRGDIAEVSEVPEDSPLWPLVTSTPDNCLGQECPSLSDCHVMKARRAAQEADLVVVNHHLLFADMALKDEGFGELLPGANAFILDEAHQLAEVASNFFGNALGSRQLAELARDTVAECLREAPDMASLRAYAERLERAVMDLRLALGVTPRRGAWREVAGETAVVDAVDATRTALAELLAALEPAAERGKGLENCWRRAGNLRERLDTLTGAEPQDHIRWFETFTRTFTLNQTPLDVAPAFRACMAARPCAWIFTSATLAVGERFDHFAHRLGLEAPATLRLDSPFDFAQNALLYVPSGLPDPNAQDYTQRVIEIALPVLRASRGRAFLLFTSHRALQQAARLLEARIDYPLLVQGSAPRGELVERFRRLGNAVLLGTSSFWEGVDVRGPALSCVIIDRLPFASPGDPLLQARLAAMAERGANGFADYQLPAAVIALKQGVGRLIRDHTDRGVMVLCDPRLLGKSYGKVFLQSLPPMQRTRELADVERFFAQETGEMR